MITSEIWIALSILVLALIAVLAFVLGKSRPQKRLSPLAGIAFAFVLAGIIFGENHFVRYALMGVGILLAIVDSYRASRRS